MEYYDRTRNKWTNMKSALPKATMAMGAAVFRSLIWLAGGIVSSTGSDLECTDNVHCYDPKNKIWSSHAFPLPTPRCYLSLVVYGDALVAVGGCTGLEQLQCASLPDVLSLYGDNHQWATMPFLLKPCHSSAVCSLGENILVFGGISKGTLLTEVQVLEKGQWSLSTVLPLAVLGVSAVGLPSIKRTTSVGTLEKSRGDDDIIVWSWPNLWN